MYLDFVKCGAFTPEIKVADTVFNTKKIIEGIDEGEKKGVEILVFPELSITGYTCGDLFYTDVLLSGAILGLDKIIKSTVLKKMLVFVGLPLKVKGLLYNVCACIYGGKLLAVVPKKYIPNYNEFYEKRYFASCNNINTEIELFNEKIPFGNKIILCDKLNENLKVGVEICEDLWSVTSPSQSHAIAGATIIANLSCSDETVGKAEYRRSMIASHSAKIVAGYIYADAGEGESTTDMVFAGHNIIAENGSVLNESNLFAGGLTLSDIDTGFLSFERSKIFNYNYTQDDYTYVYFEGKNATTKLNRSFSKTPFVPTDESDRKDRAGLILSMQAEGLKKRIKHTNAKSVVIGLSGGLDSTLALLVSVNAMKKLGRNLKDIIAVTMPCFGTTSRTYQNTIKLASALKVTLEKVDITKSVTRHLKDISHKLDEYDTTFENAQARERTQVLMDIANRENGMVVGTGDLSELSLGWATYNGDHMSMYGVNASVPKTLVRHIVSYYADLSKGKLKATLKDILDTPVSPELLPPEGDGTIAQKTENIVGPYILHDFFLYNMIRKGYSPKKIYEIARITFSKDFDEEVILKWLKIFTKRFFAQQFKRSCVPDGVKVGSVALSPRGDWRMPSDAVATLWLNELETL